jgi:CspA family cold shock protein
MTGIVKKFDERKGYGFVQPLVGIPDHPGVYFHASAIVRSDEGFRPAIPAGAEVSFDLVRGDQGPQAANVRLRVLDGSVLQREPRPRRWVTKGDKFDAARSAQNREDGAL